MTSRIFISMTIIILLSHEDFFGCSIIDIDVSIVGINICMCLVLFCNHFLLFD